MGHGASVGQSALPTQASDIGLVSPDKLNDAEREQRRATLLKQAVACARLLNTTTSLCEVNLFFMHSPGYDVEDLVNVLCRRSEAQLRRETYTWHSDVAERLGSLEQQLVTAALSHDTGAVATNFSAALSLRLLQHLPHHKGAARVRVFSRSVIEARYVMLPLLLGTVDASKPSAEQQLAIGMAQTAWAGLERDVSVPHSLWIYVRPSEYAWSEYFSSASTYTDAYIDFCRRYREGMDREFHTTPGTFAQTHHTAVLHVNLAQPSHPDLVDDVMCTVAQHVQLLHEQGQWGRLDPATIRSTQYLSDRQLHAEFSKTVGTGATVQSGSGAATSHCAPSTIPAAVPAAMSPSTSSSSLRNSGSRRSTTGSTGSAVGPTKLRRLDPDGSGTGHAH